MRFIDLQPLARLPDLLAFADIHLLPERADALLAKFEAELQAVVFMGSNSVALAD